MDLIAKASYIFIMISILSFFQAFIKKEDLNWDKSAFLVMFFTLISFSVTKAFPSVHGDIFTTWESWAMFFSIPITTLICIYLTKKSKI